METREFSVRGQTHRVLERRAEVSSLDLVRLAEELGIRSRVSCPSIAKLLFAEAGISGGKLLVRAFFEHSDVEMARVVPDFAGAVRLTDSLLSAAEYWKSLGYCSGNISEENVYLLRGGFMVSDEFERGRKGGLRETAKLVGDFVSEIQDPGSEILKGLLVEVSEKESLASARKAMRGVPFVSDCLAESFDFQPILRPQTRPTPPDFANSVEKFDKKIFLLDDGGMRYVARLPRYGSIDSGKLRIRVLTSEVSLEDLKELDIDKPNPRFILVEGKNAIGEDFRSSARFSDEEFGETRMIEDPIREESKPENPHGSVAEIPIGPPAGGSENTDKLESNGEILRTSRKGTEAKTQEELEDERSIVLSTKEFEISVSREENFSETKIDSSKKGNELLSPKDSHVKFEPEKQGISLLEVSDDPPTNEAKALEPEEVTGSEAKEGEASQFDKDRGIRPFLRPTEVIPPKAVLLRPVLKPEEHSLAKHLFFSEIPQIFEIEVSSAKSSLADVIESSQTPLEEIDCKDNSIKEPNDIGEIRGEIRHPQGSEEMRNLIEEMESSPLIQQRPFEGERQGSFLPKPIRFPSVPN